MQYLFPDIKIMVCLLINGVLCMLDYYKEATHRVPKKRLHWQTDLQRCRKGEGNQHGMLGQKVTWRHKGRKACCWRPGRSVPWWDTATAETQQRSREGSGSWHLASLLSHPQVFKSSHWPIQLKAWRIQLVPLPTQGGQRIDLRKEKRNNHINYSPNFLYVFVVNPQSIRISQKFMTSFQSVYLAFSKSHFEGS